MVTGSGGGGYVAAISRSEAAGSTTTLRRSPPIGGLRLLTDGRAAALLGQDAEVHWWCRPDAQARADELCAMLSALQPEGFDPGRREAFGNTPLLWSHAECARAWFELDRRRGALRRWRRPLTSRRIRRADRTSTA